MSHSSLFENFAQSKSKNECSCTELTSNGQIICYRCVNKETFKICRALVLGLELRTTALTMPREQSDTVSVPKNLEHTLN